MNRLTLKTIEQAIADIYKTLFYVVCNFGWKNDNKEILKNYNKRRKVVMELRKNSLRNIVLSVERGSVE